MKTAHLETFVDLDFFGPDLSSRVLLPLAEQGISAGFPSPADDYLEAQIDLNEELIANPNTTFLGRVRGCSMVDEGIDPGDLLVIDKSIPFRHGARVLAFVHDGFTVKTLSMKNGSCQLVPGNRNFPVMDVRADDYVRIWGVVTYVIKSLK